MRVTIFPQDSTTVLSGVYIYGRAATNEKEDGAHLFPLLSRGYLARTCETLTERVFPDDTSNVYHLLFFRVYSDSSSPSKHDLLYFVEKNDPRGEKNSLRLSTLYLFG